MSWVMLLFAGLMEVVWASALKRADEPPFLALTIVASIASVALLGLAVRELPIGLAYAVWVGIGVLGTVIISATFYGERFTPAQWVFFVLILVGILGMKLSSAPKGGQAPPQSPAGHQTPDDPASG